MNRKEALIPLIKTALQNANLTSWGVFQTSCDPTPNVIAFAAAFQAALRASAAPEEGMNHRTTAEPDQRSGHRSAEDAAPVAFCGWHPKHGYALQTCGHDEQHASSLLMRTDIAGNHGWSVKPFYAASTVVDHQSDNSEPQKAVVSALSPDSRKAEPVATKREDMVMRQPDLSDASRYTNNDIAQRMWQSYNSCGDRWFQYAAQRLAALAPATEDGTSDPSGKTE